MRLIDADALLEGIEQTVRFSCRDGVQSAEMRGANKVIDRINSAHTISPDEVRGVGEWIDCPSTHIQDGAKYRMCSVCNEHIAVLGHDLNYCPNCGAKMEVSEDA